MAESFCKTSSHPRYLGIEVFIGPGSHSLPGILGEVP